MIRRHFKGWLVGAAVLLTLAAVPAQAVKPAQQPINGPMLLTLHLHQCDGVDAPFVTWTGTVVIDGETYGFADQPLADPPPPPQPNDNFLSFEEHWTVFTLEDGQDPNDDPSLACTNPVVMSGHNTGWGKIRPFTGKAEGTVEDVHPDGPFADVELGSRMFWNGKALGSPPADFFTIAFETPPGTVQWKATFHIN